MTLFEFKTITEENINKVREEYPNLADLYLVPIWRQIEVSLNPQIPPEIPSEEYIAESSKIFDDLEKCFNTKEN